MPSHFLLVVLLASVTALGPFALQALSPALPAVAREFAVGPAVAQLMLSLSLVAMALTTLLWGPLSDRYGRRPVLVFGMALAGVGSALAALAPAVSFAILGRLVQAGGAVAGMVLARAVAQDLYGQARAAAVIGQITAAMVLAPMLAPALAGIIVETVGWRGIFALTAVASFSLALWIRLRLPETAPATAPVPVSDLLAGFVEVAQAPVFWGHAAFATGSLASFLFFVGSAPYVMIETYGAGPAIYGLFFVPLAGTYMLANMACGRLTARYGAERMVTAGGLFTLAAMGAGLVALALGFHHPLTLMVPAFFHSVGAGLSVPNAVAGAVAAAPGRTGTGSGLLGFVQFMVAAVVTQLAAFLPHDTPLPTILGMAVLSAVGLGLFLGWGRREEGSVGG